MMTGRWMTIPMLGLGLLSATAFAAEVARPGTVNYVEGTATIDGQPVNSKEIGSLAMQPGQELATGPHGKAEVLLTPGVFLRVGSDSQVKMISPDLTLTQVQLEKGRAGVEVDEIQKENNLQILDGNVATRLEKTGYYEFDANRPEVMVFKGKADVLASDEKGVQVKGNHELLLAGNGEMAANEKPQHLEDNKKTDDLFNWSRLRSHYLAEANNEVAGEYADAAYAPGWFWDPNMFGYTFIGPGAFYSPFGWGFAPFGWGGGWGWGGGLGWGGGWYGPAWYGGGGYYGGRHLEGRGPHEHVGTYRGGVSHTNGSGFHGEVGGFHGGGGVHAGGGGGLHGGGGGARGGGGAHR